MRDPTLKQFRCLGRSRSNRLAERFAQPYRRPRRVIEIVIVEDDVNLFCFLRQLASALGYFVDLFVRIIVIKTSGHGFSSEIRICVAAMESQVTEIAVRDFS